MDWRECNDRRLIKRISRDDDLIDSLLKSAEKKSQTALRLELDNVTAASKITLYYDCLREILETISIKKGYKIYNHDCYCAFLKEIMNEGKIADLFDRFRKIRNDLNYYGKDIKVDEAKKIIEEITKLIEECKKLK